MTLRETYIALILGLCATLVIFSTACGDDKPEKLTAVQRQQLIIDSLKEGRSAEPGEMPMILARPGKLTPNLLAGIREGFRERIERARTVMGWENDLAPQSYIVLVFPSVRDYDAEGNYEPSFQVFFDKGNTYDESIWDQEPGKEGGWTYAAEQVLMEYVRDGDQIGWRPTHVFIIAENDDVLYSANATANGLDHLFAYRNDLNLYYATADHSQGGYHPSW